VPARGYPIHINLIILFELSRGPATSPEIWRRASARMKTADYRLHSGAWYPAIEKLFRDGFVASSTDDGPFRRGKSRIAKIYILTEKGAKEVRRLSHIIRNIILPPSASE